MNAPAHLPRRPLGQVLLERGCLTEDQLRIALREQHYSQLQIGKQLLVLGFISEEALREGLAEHLDRQSIDLGQALPDPEALSLIPLELARQHTMLPLSYTPATHCLTLAMADPHDLPGQDQVRARIATPLHLQVLLAGETEIHRAIDRHYGHSLSIDGILAELEGHPSKSGGPEATEAEYSQPVVRLIDAFLNDAVKQEASDIHFEPEAGFLRIRYRIDGLLRQIRALHQSHWPAMAVRLKVISGLNIAETRAPQDGHLSRRISGRHIDFRVASQPTLHGENIVLRILDREKGIVPLDQLGLSDPQQQRLQQLMARPEGLILVTGPTGSGKTTTLYAMLQHLSSEAIHIMTLEDPVEYPLPLVRQSSVAAGNKMDFANGIRAMLRQDPDVILIGEIRDSDTACMAFRAAMTGHQVYATLHCNSALNAIPRLRDLGIPAETLAGQIIGIVGQRLLRRLCPHCREGHVADPRSCRLLGLAPDASPPTLYRPRGCPHCQQQGYRGRLALLELLRVDATLDDLIASAAPQSTLLAHAHDRGFTRLAEEGSRMVLAGHTSLEELARVVDLSDRMEP